MLPIHAERSAKRLFHPANDEFIHMTHPHMQPLLFQRSQLLAQNKRIAFESAVRSSYPDMRR